MMIKYRKPNIQRVAFSDSCTEGFAPGSSCTAGDRPQKLLLWIEQDNCFSKQKLGDMNDEVS